MSYLNIIYNRPNVCNLVNNSNKMFDNIAAMWQASKVYYIRFNSWHLNIH